MSCENSEAAASMSCCSVCLIKDGSSLIRFSSHARRARMACRMCPTTSGRAPFVRTGAAAAVAAAARLPRLDTARRDVRLRRVPPVISIYLEKKYEH